MKTYANPVGLIAAVVCAMLSGCGGVTRTAIDGSGSGGGCRYGWPVEERMAVMVGAVSVAADIGQGIRDPVARYLRDQVATEIGQHDLFAVVDATSKSVDLLAAFTGSATNRQETRQPDADCLLELVELVESAGTTVKIGPMSSQSKSARAVVNLQIRMRDGSRTYETRKTGASSKGAWGVVAQVDRRQMKEGEGVWRLDGSMAGTACVEALKAAVREAARQIDAERRRDGDVSARRVSPRTEPVIPRR